MGTDWYFSGKNDEAIVEAVYSDDAGLSITRVNGPAYCEDEYEDAILEGASDGMSFYGDGVYIFRLEFNGGQYDEWGRCELSPVWEATLIDYEVEVSDAD